MSSEPFEVVITPPGKWSGHNSVAEARAEVHRVANDGVVVKEIACDTGEAGLIYPREGGYPTASYIIVFHQ